ncbi:MAG: hypothetical protein QM765_41355 [Myxococcales bacterium]
MSLAKILVPVPLLIGLSLALSGCVDEKMVIARLEQCPRAVNRLGQKYSLSRPAKVGSAGIEEPPVPGCTHKATIEGEKGASVLWFNEKEPDRCFHLYTTIARQDLGGGSYRETVAVTDVRDCTEILQ